MSYSYREVYCCKGVFTRLFFFSLILVGVPYRVLCCLLDYCIMVYHFVFFPAVPLESVASIIHTGYPVATLESILSYTIWLLHIYAGVGMTKMGHVVVNVDPGHQIAHMKGKLTVYHPEKQAVDIITWNENASLILRIFHFCLTATGIAFDDCGVLCSCWFHRRAGEGPCHIN